MNPSLVADLYRAALAVLELLATVGAQTPLLVIADDAHWLDRPSADVLAFIGRRIEAEPIALAVALRDSLPDPFTAAQLPKLVLAGLDPGSASALLAEVAPGLPVEVRERLLADAAGNPQPTPARLRPGPDRGRGTVHCLAQPQQLIVEAFSGTGTPRSRTQPVPPYTGGNSGGIRSRPPVFTEDRRGLLSY